MKRCPACDLIHPDSAERCDCGAHFPKGAPSTTDAHARRGERQRERDELRTRMIEGGGIAALGRFMDVGVLLAGAGAPSLLPSLLIYFGARRFVRARRRSRQLEREERLIGEGLLE